MDIDSLVEDLTKMVNQMANEGYISYIDNIVFKERLRKLLEQEALHNKVEASLRE